ncbi:MAG: glycosyltransferase family 2 protein [Myxococcota bacterium]|nr:glycosyltransferase family 2 protein [Myxococcota bacterium]
MSHAGSASDATPWLSIVVPFYNEEGNVEPLHHEVETVLETIGRPAELVYVDDGSRDETPARLAELAARDPRVRVITLLENAGQSAALAAGFEAVRGEIVATLDADLQNDPADLPKLLEGLGEADVINGVRANRRDTLVRKLSSRIGNGFRNWVTGESVTDVGCSLRVMRAEHAKRVKMLRGMHRFLPTLLRMEGARVMEIPVNHRPRHLGESKYGIGNRLFVGLADVFAVRWMQSRAVRYEAVESEPKPRDEA